MVAMGMALVTTELSVQASLVTSGTVYWPENLGNQPELQVAYSVNVDMANLYTYSYTFTVGTLAGTGFTATTISSPYNGNPVNAFTIDTPFSSTIANISSVAGGFGQLTVNNSITWSYLGAFGIAAPQLSDTVSFTSSYGPGLNGGRGNDGSPSVAWSTTPGSLVAAPVPEASTVMAGALMLLPFGIGAIRSLRKDRTA